MRTFRFNQISNPNPNPNPELNPGSDCNTNPDHRREKIATPTCCFSGLMSMPRQTESHDPEPRLPNPNPNGKANARLRDEVEALGGMACAALALGQKDDAIRMAEDGVKKVNADESHI